MKKKFYFNNKVLFALLFFSASLGMNAQQKIGTNPTTISSNTNLEIEATNGSKLKVSSDTGKVTIADGTQGAGKILTSDSNGVASWKDQGNATVIVDGIVVNPNSNIFFSSASYNDVGVSINFPKAGVYSVKSQLYFRYQTGCQTLNYRWNGVSVLSQSLEEVRQLCGTPFADLWNANWIVVVAAPGTVQLQALVTSGVSVELGFGLTRAISLN